MKLFSEISFDVYLHHMNVKRIGVDLSWVLSKIVHMNSATALNLVDDHAVAMFATKVIQHVSVFSKRKKVVVLIVDNINTRQPTKIATRQRARARAANLLAAQDATRNGDVALSKKLLRKSVCITASMIEAIRARCHNDPLLVFCEAPFEF